MNQTKIIVDKNEMMRMKIEIGIERDFHLDRVCVQTVGQSRISHPLLDE